MALSTQEQMLVEQRVANESKSVGLAYLLLIFFGGLGIHRFYLGRTGSAVAMLIMTILGFFTVAIVVGVILLVIVGLWLLVDLFLIPGMVHQHKETVRQQFSSSLVSTGPATA